MQRPLKRKPVSKYRSSKQFRSQSSRTQPINMRAAPMRGGIRL